MDESVAAGAHYEKGDWSAETVEIINDDWTRVTTGDDNTHINIVNQSGKTLHYDISNIDYTYSEFANGAEMAYRCKTYNGIADATTWEYSFTFGDPDSRKAAGKNMEGYFYDILRYYTVTVSLVDGEYEVSYTQQ